MSPLRRLARTLARGATADHLAGLAGRGNPVALAELRRRSSLAELHGLSRRVANGPVSASPEPDPVLGYRAAADVLGIGREQVRRVVQGLPAHRQPTTVKARGGHDAVWWPSPAACRTWWAEVHRVDPPAPRRRRKRTRATAARHTLTGTLDEALAEI